MTGKSGKKAESGKSNKKKPAPGKPKQSVTRSSSKARAEKSKPSPSTRFSSFPDLDPNPVLELDRDGVVRYANAAAAAWGVVVGASVPQPFVPPFWHAYFEADGVQLRDTVEVPVGKRIFTVAVRRFVEREVVHLYAYDITEQKRSERILLRLQERFALAAHAAGFGVWDWDLIENRLVWDGRMYELYGCRHEDFDNAYEAWLARIHPEDVERCNRESEEARQGIREYESEFRVVWPDGTVRFLRASGMVQRDESGEPVRMTGINSDITENKLAEEAALRSTEQYRTLVENLSEVIFTVDMEGVVVFVSPAVRINMGYAPAELVGKNYVELVHPDDLERIRASFLNVVNGGHRPADYRFRNKTGHYAWFHVSSHRMLESGRVIGLQGILTDVTIRHEAEREHEIIIRFLRMINESGSKRELIRKVTDFIRETSGCEAVGVRLREGDDYPYYESRGFPRGFLLLENSLCQRDIAGQLVRDELGHPLIECMCGTVICGRTDPSQPFFTAGGSFWSNGTTELLASTTDTERQTRTRNRCNGEGYESVALIPLSVGEERIGLIQMNDRRKGMFTPDGIEFWERLTGYLAVGLSKLRVEEALRESEEKFRLLVNSTEDIIFTLDADGRHTGVYGPWVAKSGMTPEQFLGKTARDIFGEAGAVHEEAKNRAQGGEYVIYDWKIPGPGAERQYQTSLSPLRNAAGEITGLVGLGRDLTDYLKTRDALLDSEERFHIMFRDSAAGMVLVDLGFRFIQVNATFCAMLGYSEGELLGKSFQDVTEPEDRFIGGDLARRALEGEIKGFQIEKRYRRRDGGIVWGFVSSTLLRDVHSVPHYFVTQVQDITARKDAEASLLRELAVNRAMAELSAALVAARPGTDAIADLTIRAALTLTASSGGVIGTIDATTGEFHGHAVIRNPDGTFASPDAHAPMVPDANGRYQGLGGVSLNSREAYFINATAPAERIEGMPSSHAPLSRILLVPVGTGDRLVGQIMLSDSSRDYTEADVDVVGRLAQLFAVAVTRQEADEAAAESAGRFRSIVENTDAGYFFVDADGYFRDVNDAWLRLHRYASREEIVGRPYSVTQAPEERKKAEDVVAGILAGDSRFLTGEFRRLCADGSVGWHTFSARPVVRHGKTIGIEGFLIDTTQQRAVEQALRQSEFRYRELYDNIRSGVAIYEAIDGGRDFVFRDLNKAGEKIESDEKKKLIGRSLVEARPGVVKLGLLDVMRRVLLTGRSEYLPATLYVDERMVAWYENFVYRLPSGEIVAVFDNVTEKVQADEKLIVSLREKETLLRELYHRTKNNMQVICSMLSLQSSRTANEEVRVEFVEMGNRIRSMALVHEKLYESKNLTRIQLGEYAETLALLLSRSYASPERIVRFVFRIEEVSVTIESAVPCGLILNELISNAFKYAFAGRSSGEISIGLARDADGFVDLTVADDGAGFPPGFDVRKDGKFGLQSIIAIAESQLAGEIVFESGAGVRCRVRFRDSGRQETRI